MKIIVYAAPLLLFTSLGYTQTQTKAVPSFASMSEALGKAEHQTATPTVYYDGNIITMEGNKPQYVEALVSEGDKIVFVGKKAKALKKYPSAVQNNS